jgi:hypothetical protein
MLGRVRLAPLVTDRAGALASDPEEQMVGIATFGRADRIAVRG